MEFIKTTEQSSLYDNLEQMSTQELLFNINKEDQKVALAVQGAIDQITAVVDAIVIQLNKNGRLFYIGAGTSGRLGVLDASECPPTFGVEPTLVVGVIAGGDYALKNAVENAEDQKKQGWLDLQAHNITKDDFVLGIAASGTTPYVIGALEQCKLHGIATAGLSCNLNSPLSAIADKSIEVVVGPEFVTASSRMKAGSAQKMVLNMISTSSMIKIGRIRGNQMVDMKMSNAKLRQRGIGMLQQELSIDTPTAAALLDKHNNVRQAILAYKNQSL